MNSPTHNPARRKMIPFLVSLIGVAIVIAGLMAINQPKPVVANTSDMGNAVNQYPAINGTRLDACNLCHTASIPALNPYGTDYLNNGRNQAALAAIEGLDSDGDGFINIAEISALTFPGNSNDHPLAASTATSTATQPVPPTETLAPSTPTQTETLPPEAPSPTPTIVPSSPPTETPTGEPTNPGQPTPTETSAPPSPPPPGGSMTINPVADAYVSRNNPDSNYGANKSIRVDQGPPLLSYLKFEIRGLNGADIAKATLEVYANSSSDSGIEARGEKNTDWTEYKINFKNAPQSERVLGKVKGFHQGEWVSIDVSDWVKQEGTFGLVLAGRDKTQINLASREDKDHAPRLVIQLGEGTQPPAPTETEPPNPTATPPPAPTETGAPPTPTETAPPVEMTPTPTATETPVEMTPTATATETTPVEITPTPQPPTPTTTATQPPTEPTATATLPPPESTPTATATQPGPTATDTATQPPAQPTATPTQPVATIEPTLPPASGGEILIYAADNVDCGSGGAKQVSDMINTLPGTVQLGGDTVWGDGSASNYNNCYAPTYGRFKARTHPAIGNHEYNTSGASAYQAYFGAAAGPAGKFYYSYDLGAWHIVILNSNCSNVGGCQAGSPEEQWLKADLAASTKQCTIAVFHHPRYSSSTHGNNPSVTPFWQDLYSAGAELVLDGHDHDYERFAPMDPTGQRDDAKGLREIVSGTGGIPLYGIKSVQPNSEVRINGVFGAIRFVLNDGSYTWEFLPAGGKTATDSGSGTCH